ncbi:CcmD family protein [Desulfohalovibrio reitneri]|nr:CcmD family protein [Desulfohalovibrio reitneri]
MEYLDYVLAANAAVWIGIAAYLGFLGSRQTRLRRRMEQLALLRGEEE